MDLLDLETVERDDILVEDLVDVLRVEVVGEGGEEVEGLGVPGLRLGQLAHRPVATEHHSGHSEHV